MLLVDWSVAHHLTVSKWCQR